MEKDANAEKTEKPKKEKPAVARPTPAHAESMGEDFRGIVRIAGKDVHGRVPLKRSLTYVRGIGTTLSAALANVLHEELGIAPTTPIGKLTDEQIEKIDRILFHVAEHKLPPYLLNRRGDMLDGTSKHLIMTDLLFAWKQDIEKEKKLYTWKGYRHAYGQKVRGQRTRNTGRTGLAVGVLRKAVLAAQKAATTPEGRGGPGKPAGAAGAPAAAAPAGAAASGAKPAGGAAKPAAKKPEAK